MPAHLPTGLIADPAQFVRRLGERFGLRAAQAAVVEDEAVVARHPCEGRADRLAAEFARNGLPEPLLQAFAATPLEPGDTRFIGRTAARERLLACLDAWREQRPALVAVVGPQGCGVTSLLRQIEGGLRPGEQLTYRALDGRPASARDALVQCARLFGIEEAPVSVEQLAATINALDARLIVLDNGHYLACRIMGASESIRTLGALMVATQERHQWLLGCRLEAWRRLSYAHRADRFFTEVIALEAFDCEELTAVIAARCARAGLVLAEADSAADSAPAPVQDPAAAFRPPDAFMTQLHALSSGLPAAAGCHFLRALAADETGWHLGSCLPFDYGALKTLDRMESFTLAEIAVHGALTAAEHRSLLRLPEQESQMLLQRLCALGLLEHVARENRETRYRLVPVHVGTVIACLHNANYLY